MNILDLFGNYNQNKFLNNNNNMSNLGNLSNNNLNYNYCYNNNAPKTRSSYDGIMDGTYTSSSQNNFSHGFNFSNNASKLSIPTRKIYSGNSCVNQNKTNSFADEIYDDPEEEFETFIEKMGNNLIYFIKTQKGSRYMQKFISKISSADLTDLLKRISLYFKDIMTDNYGNYFMQKLMQRCTPEQRVYVMENVKLIK